MIENKHVCRFGEMSYEKIKTFNSNVTMKKYPNMGHTSCPQEMMDVKRFLSNNLGL